MTASWSWLAGIINQRKKILVDAHTQLDGQAVSGLADYEQKRQAGADLVPVPALFVVVDEFAEMMEQHPEFLNAFKQIVQVGRGLRIHLLLASQTIANIASQWEKLKGNITYRIALRTTDTAESKSIIGTPEAHYIKGFEAGVGYLCTGPTEDPIKFRTAYTGGPYQPTSTHPDDTPTSTPPPKSHMPPVRPIYRHRRRNWYRPMNTTPSDTATLADVVLQALSTGYDGPPTARPWLPPLRQPTALGNLLAHHQLSHLSIPVGIVDLPYWLTQKPWTITLDATTFSAAIGGVGKTGKSTFIQTLLLSAAYTHSPHDLAIFGLDFSSGKLVSNSKRSPTWFASDFAAEIGVGKYPRLAVFSGDPRGAVHGRVRRWAPTPIGVVSRDQVGDLRADRWRADQPGRGGAQVAGRRVHGDRDSAHGQRRGAGRVSAQARPSRASTRLATRSRSCRDCAVDRGDQSPGHRVGDHAGKRQLGLTGAVPARVPAEIKHTVLKTVDDAVAVGLSHKWACALWEVSDWHWSHYSECVAAEACSGMLT